MAAGTSVQTAFFSGEWSPYAQGRFDDARYKTALSVCFNAMPIETGAWTRRPGTQDCGYTRNGGVAGRLIAFDLAENQPYNMEFTDGFLRFWDGPSVVTTNDDTAIAAISTANPAVVYLSAAVTWATGDTGFFKNLGVNNPLLQNRFFTLTKVDTTHFSLVDPLTGNTVDGSTLGTFVSGTMSHIHEVATPYFNGSWGTNILHSVQAEEQAVLLNGAQPQVLSVAASQTPSAFAQFEINPVNFQDGPYLDPVKGGVLVTPGGTSGSITLTIAAQTYSASVAYDYGDYVLSSGITYQSLITANIGNTPVSTPGAWEVVQPTAFSSGGFANGDIGRMVRLFSQPADWASGTTYATGTEVTYNNAYWISLVSSNTGIVPGSNVTNWGPAPQAAGWSWGKITGFASLISGTLSGVAQIGNMTGNAAYFSIPASSAGLSAAFDGNNSKTFSLSATAVNQQILGDESGQVVGWVGQNYTGATAQTIQSAAVIPTSDWGFTVAQTPANFNLLSITAYLYASNSNPSSATNGTLLGSTTTTNNAGNISISSNNILTTYNYVWVYLVATIQNNVGKFGYASLGVAQVQFYKPASGGGLTATMTVLGAPLPSTAIIETWQLGAYSDAIGWPTCGTYHEGRIWLNDPAGNVINGSVSDAAVDMSLGISFAPTAADGTVSDSNGIRYVLNAPDNNIIFWMQPDLQGIIVGAQGGEWLVQATTQNAPLTSTNMQAHRVTRVGCANIEPRRTELTTVFVQKLQRKTIEYFADVFSGKFTAPNLNEMSKHLTIGGIEELAYQQELMPTIWARLATGQLIGAAYKRDTLFSSQGPKFCGWHRHTLGSGRTVQSITVGPDQTGNLEALMMTTKDANGLFHVELMAGMSDEAVTLNTAWHVDSAIIPSSAQVNAATLGNPYGTLTLNGLWPLNGSTVMVWAGGLDCGNYVVSNGSITVPFGDSIAQGPGGGLFTQALYNSGIQILVGFDYTSQGQQLPPVDPRETGAQVGVAFGKQQRGQKIAIKLANTGPGGDNGGPSFGGTFATVRRAAFKSQGGDGTIALTQQQMFTGMYWNTLEDTFSREMMTCWQVNRGYPMTLTAFGEFLHTQDE